MNTEQLPKALRLAEKLRDIIRLLDCDFADDIDTNDLKLAAMELESLHARVQELETLAAPLNVWQQAIDAELVSAHLGVAPNDATFEGAQKAIHDLLCWHVGVATNPATNGGQRLTDAKPIVWPVAMPEPVAAQVRFKRENDTTWSRWKDCAVGDAREIEAYTYTLVNCNCWNYEVRFLYTEQQVRELLANTKRSTNRDDESVGLREALVRAHDWMDSQADSQSKGGHATFDLMMLREERNAIKSALDEAPQPQEDARDTERYLDYLIHHQARVLNNLDEYEGEEGHQNCGYWLEWTDAKQNTTVQAQNFKTPQEAIDAAIAAAKGE